MKTITLDLHIINNISKFIQLASQLPGKVTVKSGRHVVDGKSIMGIYSLNLSEPVIVDIEDDDYSSKFIDELKDIIL